MKDEEIETPIDQETKKNVFDIPAQYANFISFVGNEEEICFQFGQQGLGGRGELTAIAKIAMTHANAIRMLQFLQTIEKK